MKYGPRHTEKWTLSSPPGTDGRCRIMYEAKDYEIYIHLGADDHRLIHPQPDEEWIRIRI